MDTNRKRELLSDPNDRRHGTRYGYAQGCRCEKCKAANREYFRKSRAGGNDFGHSEAEKRYRAKRLKSLEENPNDRMHGSHFGYSLGCRCDECIAAETEYQHQYYLRKKNEPAS